MLPTSSWGKFPFAISQLIPVADGLIITNLDYSRVEVAGGVGWVGARHRTRSCDHPPPMFCNETDAVRSARP